MEAQGERMCSSYSFTTSTLDGVSGQRHARPRFTPGEGPTAPIVQEAGRSLRAGTVTEATEKSLLLYVP
jgi:hypothetical protein